jgi:hypothetical protein
MMPWVRAAVRSCAEPGSAADAQTRRPAASRLPARSSRAVGAFRSSTASDRARGRWDQRAVEDDVGQQPAPGHRLVQVVGGRGEQGDRLTDIASGGGNPTWNPAARRVRVSPLRRWARASRACRPGSSRRQRDRRWWRWVRIRSARWFSDRVDSGIEAGKTATRLPVGASSLVDCLSHREPRLTRLPTFTTPLTCTIRLEMAQ